MKTQIEPNDHVDSYSSAHGLRPKYSCCPILNINLCNQVIDNDFILTGLGLNNIEYAILIELKQWSIATLSEKVGIVNTYAGRLGEHTHLSYQAWSYASLLQNSTKLFMKIK